MNFNKLYSLTASIFLLINGLAYSTNYYVDSQNGNDSNSGTSENLPWKTISKVNSKSYLPGDNILFKGGASWREQLNVTSSGLEGSPITISSYGTGAAPVISGASILTGFELHSGSIWKKTISLPRQVFFNNTRGVKKASLSELLDENDWFHSSGYIYIYLGTNPGTSGVVIEASIRNYAVSINASNIVLKDLQVEKTFNDAVYITTASQNVLVDNLNFLQWTNEINAVRGGIGIYGKNCIVKNSSFGLNTGNDIADQNWSGFMAIMIGGENVEVFNNSISHNSLENEDAMGKYAYGIRVIGIKGITKIHKNIIYHVASNGILVDAVTKAGDEIHIYENTISYTGQAGIAAYKTRASDGSGGKGYVYKNTISYANRLGGEVGGGGNRAAGIHFNDGIQSSVDPAKPYIRWFCYENVIYSSQSPNERNSPDSDGIAIDYNANGVELYRNLIYDCDGKGIYIWNADNCKIYYNVLYGNDCGITVSASASGGESTNYNEVYNNVFYKNFNGSDRGKNYNTEIYFGLNGNNNRFLNNILFAASGGYAYTYNSTNSSGNVLDYNLVYSESGLNGYVGYDGSNGKQIFSKWKSNHSIWDNNSINADPLFVDEASHTFKLKTNSPAINKGTLLGLSVDYSGLPINGSPDIGAFESSELINKLKIKILLEGPFNGNSMNTLLASQQLIPLSNPYKKSPWFYNGNETLSSVQPDVVDWVLVELRSGLSVDTRAGQYLLLLKNDGSIVDISGSHDVPFAGTPAGSYYIVIYHRNHLPVMSSAKVDLSVPSAAYDFTASINQAYGNSLVLLQNGLYGMISGDTDANGIVDQSDLNTIGNNIFQNGYNDADLDMNRVINIMDFGKYIPNLNKKSAVPN